jgi:hypothetical protein
VELTAAATLVCLRLAPHPGLTLLFPAMLPMCILFRCKRTLIRAHVMYRCAWLHNVKRLFLKRKPSRNADRRPHKTRYCLRHLASFRLLDFSRRISSPRGLVSSRSWGTDVPFQPECGRGAGNMLKLWEVGCLDSSCAEPLNA